MRPAQLLRQCRNNLFLRKRLGKLHHAGEVRHLEAAAELPHQILRHRGKDLLPVPGTLSPQNIAADAVAHPPVKQGQGRVHGRGRLSARVGDQLAQVSDQALGRMRAGSQLDHASSLSLDSGAATYVDLQSGLPNAVSLVHQRGLLRVFQQPFARTASTAFRFWRSGIFQTDVTGAKTFSHQRARHRSAPRSRIQFINHANTRCQAA